MPCLANGALIAKFTHLGLPITAHYGYVCAETHTIHKTCMHHSNQLRFYHSLHEENWISWNKSLICTVVHKATDPRTPYWRESKISTRVFSQDKPIQPPSPTSATSFSFFLKSPYSSSWREQRSPHRNAVFLVNISQLEDFGGWRGWGFYCICNPGGLNFTILPQLQQREDFKCGFQAWQVSNLGDLQLKNTDAINPIITQESG